MQTIKYGFCPQKYHHPGGWIKPPEVRIKLKANRGLKKVEDANIDEKRSEVCTEAGPELALCGWVEFKERAKAKHPRGEAVAFPMP